PPLRSILPLYPHKLLVVAKQALASFGSQIFWWFLRLPPCCGGPERQRAQTGTLAPFACCWRRAWCCSQFTWCRVAPGCTTSLTWSCLYQACWWSGGCRIQVKEGPPVQDRVPLFSHWASARRWAFYCTGPATGLPPPTR